MSAAIDLEEKIMRQIVSKLSTIPGATVKTAKDGGLFEYSAANCPLLIVRKVPKTTRRHLRGSQEMVLGIEVLLAVAQDQADPPGALAELHGKVAPIFEANRRWNDGTKDLAADTEVVDGLDHETETQEGTLSGSLTAAVIARADLADPAVPVEI